MSELAITNNQHFYQVTPFIFKLYKLRPGQLCLRNSATQSHLYNATLVLSRKMTGGSGEVEHSYPSGAPDITPEFI